MVHIASRAAAGAGECASGSSAVCGERARWPRRSVIDRQLNGMKPEYVHLLADKPHRLRIAGLTVRSLIARMAFLWRAGVTGSVAHGRPIRSHTTLVTVASRHGRHGIYANTQFDPDRVL